MKHEDDLNDDWNFVLIHQSPIPLRWIANALGSLASSSLLSISFAQEDERMDTFKYKINCFIWDKFFPIYDKYGSYYKAEIDIEEDL